MKNLCLYFVLTCTLLSCSEPESATAIFVNGNIYTVDESVPHAEAIAIKDDKIVAVGSNEEIEKLGGKATKIHDLDGQFVMPGIIEGHGHFTGIGRSLMELNLMKVRSWQEVDSMVKSVSDVKPGDWIIGRGWHQDKWDQLPEMHVEGYPNAQTMSDFTEDNPVLLVHASGHSLFANQAAMDRAGISKETPEPAGGRIVKDLTGQPLGIFEERAMKPIYQAYSDWYDNLPKKDREDYLLESIRLAEQECLSKGVTSFQDAGSSKHIIEEFKSLSEANDLNIRLWVMLRDTYEAMKDSMQGLPYINPENAYFTCRAIKSEIDGALGAYGAWLLEPYSDKPDFVGQNTTEVEEVSRIADLALTHDMQLCVHAIGDKGNRVMLDLFEEKLGAEARNKRWRMEHAQHLHPIDIPRFADLGVIASMQAVHCTSDAPFVEKRLGPHRSKTGAYVWKSLLKSGAVVSNGTDAPVEDVDPIPNFYASVTRTRPDNGMIFFREEAIDRGQAIYSMTMAPAYAAFEESSKGSLSIGKLADFIVLSNDLITCQESEILDTKVLATYVGGELKYEYQTSSN